MKKYKLVVAKITEPLNEYVVELEAKDKGEVLVKNCELRPGTFVKEVIEIV